MSTLTMPICTSSYETFVQSVYSVPILTREEEIELLTKFKEDGDSKAGDKLVLSNLRFVIHVVRGYSGYGFNSNELVQEGCVGLLKAIDKFDLAYGVKFLTFALYDIKAAIHDYALKNYKIMKVATTKEQRKLFFKLKTSKDHLGWFNAKEITELSEKMGVPVEDIKKMESRLFLYDKSFDAPVGASEEEEMYSPAGFISSGDSDNPATIAMGEDERQKMMFKIEKTFDTIDDRAVDIFKSRWLSDSQTSLRELSEQYGVSLERVRQIEVNVFKKVKQELLCA